MTLFWLLAAGMILLALAFVVPPLLRGKDKLTIDRNTLNISVIRQQITELEADLQSGKLEQAAYLAARADLEKQLLQDVDITEMRKQTVTQRKPSYGLAVMIALLVPLISIPLYLTLGQPGLIDPATLAGQSNASMPVAGSQMSIDEMISSLASKLEQDPNNAEGWNMLARSYMMVERFQDAANAYSRLQALVGNNPEVMIQYADALAMAQGGKISGKPYELIQAVLQQQPDHPQAIWMAGLAEEEQGNYPQAIARWESIRPLLQDQPELLQSLDNLLARAREKASGNAVAETSVSNSQGTPAATETKAVTLNVSLDETIADKADPGDSVFVFAQAMNGPPMPLAVARLQVSELPVTVTLDDSMAMMPQMRLSAFDQVKVGARVSKSGQAMPQSGDLSGEVLNITPGQKDAVWVEINQVLP